MVDDMCMQVVWYQVLQSSHATPHCLHVTALRHMPHRNLGLRGPGLGSMSCIMRSRLIYSRLCVLLGRCAERRLSLRVYIRLLMLSVSVALGGCRCGEYEWRMQRSVINSMSKAGRFVWEGMLVLYRML